jgi:hypothetical protein
VQLVNRHRRPPITSSQWQALYLVSGTVSVLLAMWYRPGGGVMNWIKQRGLTVGLALMLAVLVPTNVGSAAPLAASDPVFGVGTGSTVDEGEMMPTGNGRFTIDDRVYAGRSLGRSVAGVSAECFTGDLRSVEEWSLETPRMIGTHEGVVTIRSDRGALTLRLRGQMEQFTASGTWEIVRATGACAALDGDGKYTATYSSSRSGPNLHLTFDGVTQA